MVGRAAEAPEIGATPRRGRVRPHAPDTPVPDRRRAGRNIHSLEAFSVMEQFVPQNLRSIIERSPFRKRSARADPRTAASRSVSIPRDRHGIDETFPIDDRSVDLAGRDDSARLVDRLHLEGQTSAAGVEGRFCHDLDAASYSRCATMLDADRGSYRRLICPEQRGCCPDCCRLHPGDQPRRPENRHVTTTQRSGRVGFSDFMTHRTTVRLTSITSHHALSGKRLDPCCAGAAASRPTPAPRREFWTPKSHDPTGHECHPGWDAVNYRELSGWDGDGRTRSTRADQRW